MFGEFEVEATNDAFATNDGWEAKRSIRKMIVGRNGEDAHFVIQDAVDDLNDASSDAVVSSAFFVDDVIGFVDNKIRNIISNLLW